ncbi:MAG: DUF4234 domain-containing protein [Lachnospiraceae bacterium]|nr:DUF4234 domain-containing protein [Lachnospiraceae bacterium]
MICPKCGAQSADGTTYCPSCGVNMVAASQNPDPDDFRVGFEDPAPAPEPAPAPAQNTYDQNTYSQNTYSQNTYSQPSYDQAPPVTPPGSGAGIMPRNIAVAIILSIVTCGIYGIYWFIVLTNEANQLSGHPDDTSGGIAFLLTLVTCGIYGWFWAAKMGEKTDIIKGNPAGSSNVLFILLQIFGLGIVNYALAQDAINKAVS